MAIKKNVSIGGSRPSKYDEFLLLEPIGEDGKGDAVTFKHEDRKQYMKIAGAVCRMNKKHAPKKWIMGMSEDKKEILVQRVADEVKEEE